MHVLVGIGAAVALLYFWLTGHWFARVLAFLVFAAVFGFVAAVLLPAEPHAVGNPVGFILGAVLAWPVSGIPIYYQRYQLTGSIARPQRRS